MSLQRSIYLSKNSKFHQISLQNRRNFVRILGEQWRKRGERETRVAREGRSAIAGGKRGSTTSERYNGCFCLSFKLFFVLSQFLNGPITLETNYIFGFN